MGLYIIIGGATLAALTLSAFAVSSRVDKSIKDYYFDKPLTQDLQTIISQITNIEQDDRSLDNITKALNTSFDHVLPVRNNDPVEDMGSLYQGKISGGNFFESVLMDMNDKFSRLSIMFPVKDKYKITLESVQKILPSLIDSTRPPSLERDGDGYAITTQRQVKDKYGEMKFSFDKDKNFSSLDFAYYDNQKSRDLWELVHLINSLERMPDKSAFAKNPLIQNFTARQGSVEFAISDAMLGKIKQDDLGKIFDLKIEKSQIISPPPLDANHGPIDGSRFPYIIYEIARPNGKALYLDFNHDYVLIKVRITY